MLEGVILGNLFFEFSICICVSFGMVFNLLGGEVCEIIGMLSLVLVKGELFYDIVWVLSGYFDIIVMCYFVVGLVVEFVEGSCVFVINGGDGVNEYFI